MRCVRRLRYWGVLGALFVTGRAGAVPCADVPLPNKVFGTGGSNFTATLKRVAHAIADDLAGRAEEQTSIFYTDPNACDAYAEFVTGKSTRVFKYWVAGQTADQTCEAPVGGQALDFAYLPIDEAHCGAATLPPGIVMTRAPAYSLSLITGWHSGQNVISAAALYFIYGWGRAGQVAPWSDGSAIYAPATFARELLGLALGVPYDHFVNDAPFGGFSGGVVSGITGYAGTDPVKASQAIAFVDSSTAHTNRAKIKVLAYQHFGQACGVLPDSTESSLDRRNVRLGKYALWEQGRLLTRVSDLGLPLNPRAHDFVGWFDGTTDPPGASVSALDEVIKAGGVPDCAMQVQRSGAFGPLSSYAPPEPCGCRFEAVAQGSTECSACATDADCGRDAPSCNFGYCEAYGAR